MLILIFFGRALPLQGATLISRHLRQFWATFIFRKKIFTIVFSPNFFSPPKKIFSLSLFYAFLAVLCHPECSIFFHPKFFSNELWVKQGATQKLSHESSWMCVMLALESLKLQAQQTTHLSLLKVRLNGQNLPDFPVVRKSNWSDWYWFRVWSLQPRTAWGNRWRGSNLYQVNSNEVNFPQHPQNKLFCVPKLIGSRATFWNRRVMCWKPGELISCTARESTSKKYICWHFCFGASVSLFVCWSL